MNCLQFDLFYENDEAKEALQEAREAKEMTHKVRRGLFARHNELSKMYIELSMRMELLEKNICKDFNLN